MDQLFKSSLRKDILERLGKLPRGLDNAYRDIFDMIKSQDGSASEVAERAFNWLISFQEVPSSGLLKAAVSQGPSQNTVLSVDLEQEYILEACQNLLVYDAKLDKFGFSHLSVREYPEKHLFTTARSHAYAGKICSMVLVDFVFHPLEGSLRSDIDLRFWYNPPHGSGKEALGVTKKRHAHDKNSDFLRWLRAAKSRGGSAYLHRLWPLVWYSRRYWAKHLREAGAVEATQFEGLQSLLWQFFGDFEQTALPFESWYSLFRKTTIHSLFAVPGISWGRLTKDYLPPFDSFRGKIYFAICMTGLDQITEDRWSHWASNGYLPDADRGILLYAAFSTGCRAMTRFILNLQAKSGPHDATEQFDKIIKGSVTARQDDSVELLLQNGADPNRYHGMIHMALQFGKEQFVEAFLRHGADANGISSEGHLSHLATAIFSCSPNMIRSLLEHGANPNFISAEGYPLHIAVRERNVDVVEILLDYGADVDISGESTITALQMAAARLDVKVVKFLIAQGANVDKYSGRYGSPLQAAAAATAGVVKDQIEIVTALLDHSADPNTPGGEFGCVLQAAVYSRRIPLIQQLLNAGADVNASGGKFGTALQIATVAQDTTIIQMLLDREVDINISSDQCEYTTPLQAAVSSGDISIIQLFIDAGADVNAYGSCHGSALRIGARSGNVPIVRLLLGKGADVNGPKGRPSRPPSMQLFCQAAQR